MTMVTNTQLMKFARLPSEKIFRGLENGDWEGVEKEAALSILKSRGKDLSRLDKEPEIKPANQAKLDLLRDKVDKLLMSSDNAQRNAVKTLMEGVRNIYCLPEETVNYLMGEIDSLLGDKKAKGMALKGRGKRNVHKRRKSTVYMAPEHKKIVANINRRKLTKAQKILLMYDEGVTRQEIESLALATMQYVYMILKSNGRI